MAITCLQSDIDYPSIDTAKIRADRDITSCLDIVRQQCNVALDKQTLATVQDSYLFVDNELEKGRQIYGLTSGFGPLISQSIPLEANSVHQHHLIYHLATGVGAPLDPQAVRAIMLGRLLTLCSGHSGASCDLLYQLTMALNTGFMPYIPECGTVGASGDLTPLSHLALALMGEGHCLKEEKKQPAMPALKALGLDAFSFTKRDALALVNGTSAMTGIALINGARMGGLIDIAISLSLLHAELMQAQREAWHPSLSQLRGQASQHHVAEKLWHISADSGCLTPAKAMYSGDGVISQDPYSTRCVPQILGAVIDQWSHHQRIVTDEWFGIDDNPVFDTEQAMVLHGGNFYGQPVAFASDGLALACITLGVLAERRIARLCDPTRNHDLPAFLQPSRPGINSGFMGAQVTASALLAEMRTRAIPASIQSIPTNNNNQDIVPMGTIAARNARDLISRCGQLLAIEALCLAQATDLRGHSQLASASKGFIQQIRETSAYLDNDRPLSDEIETLSERFLAHWVPLEQTLLSPTSCHL